MKNKGKNFTTQGKGKLGQNKIARSSIIVVYMVKEGTLREQKKSNEIIMELQWRNKLSKSFLSFQKFRLFFTVECEVRNETQKGRKNSIKLLKDLFSEPKSVNLLLLSSTAHNTYKQFINWFFPSAVLKGSSSSCAIYKVIELPIRRKFSHFQNWHLYVLALYWMHSSYYYLYCKITQAIN